MPTVTAPGGRKVATPRASMVIVRYDKVKRKQDAKPSEVASSLVRRAAKAMSKPGIAKRSVFTGKPLVYAYSILTSDTSKVMRRDAQGKITVGQLVNGKFKADKDAVRVKAR